MAQTKADMILRREFVELSRSPNPFFSVGLHNNDLFTWEVIILGPHNTFYDGGVFKARLTFPKEYPDAPPTMMFTTAIYHPNIDESGYVCVDQLSQSAYTKHWSPIHTAESFILNVIALLSCPDLSEPMCNEAANDWMNDYNGEFKKKVYRVVNQSQYDVLKGVNE